MTEKQWRMLEILDHYDMEWGKNSCCDLDVEISSALSDLNSTYSKLDDLTTRFPSSIPLRFPKRK